MCCSSCKCFCCCYILQTAPLKCRSATCICCYSVFPTSQDQCPVWRKKKSQSFIVAITGSYCKPVNYGSCRVVSFNRAGQHVLTWRRSKNGTKNFSLLLNQLWQRALLNIAAHRHGAFSCYQLASLVMKISDWPYLNITGRKFIQSPLIFLNIFLCWTWNNSETVLCWQDR